MYIETLICEPQRLCQILEFSYFSEKKFGNGSGKVHNAKDNIRTKQNKTTTKQKKEILTQSKHLKSFLRSTKYHNTFYATIIPSTLLFHSKLSETKPVSHGNSFI